MNYSAIYNQDVINGVGFRVSLFVSGCGKTPKCKHCHNKKAWDFNSGKLYTKETEDKLIKYASKPFIAGLSLLGGEVFDNLRSGDLLNLVRRFKEEFPNKNIWAWSGYTYEELLKRPDARIFLEYVDILVDGEFVFELKDLDIKFRGSSNQRVIDVQASLHENRVVLYNIDEV